MVDSQCVTAGTAYLVAFGFGIAAVVVSPWLVLAMRAAYTNDGGFRRGLLNATPLWAAAVPGVVLLFQSGNSLVDIALSCIPPSRPGVLGGVALGLGGAAAAIAVARLVAGRIRVDRCRRIETRDEAASGARSAESPSAREARHTPLTRRRVIIQYGVTYGIAVVLAVVGFALW